MKAILRMGLNARAFGFAVPGCWLPYPSTPTHDSSLTARAKQERRHIARRSCTHGGQRIMYMTPRSATLEVVRNGKIDVEEG